jgi:hypothetical protein
VTALEAPPETGIIVAPWLLWWLVVEVGRLGVALEDRTFERDAARAAVEAQQDTWSAYRAANPPRPPRATST